MIKFIASIAVLILSVAFAFLYVMPEYNRTQNNLADLKILNETLKSTETMKELVRQIGDSLDSIDPAITSRSRVFLPETIDEIRFANNLQSIGARNGMILMDIKVGEKVKKIEKVIASGTVSADGKVIPVNGPSGSLDANKVVDVNIQKIVGATAEKKYITTKASFSLSATYKKFDILLNDLEKSLGIIDITLLSFQENKEALDTKDIKNTQKDTLLYKYTVEIETYSLK